MSNQKKFGTFEGVFTPSLLTILGVIMYLRMGWIVGNASSLFILITIIILAHIISITTGLSISYAMDAMSVTAFTRTESSTGSVDKDYSGVGFTYDLGGATLKAGFVDANDISIMDFGVNFSF